MGLWTPADRDSRGVLTIRQPGDPVRSPFVEYSVKDHVDPISQASEPLTGMPSRFAEHEARWLIPVSLSWVALTMALTSDTSPRSTRCDHPEREE